MRRPDPDTDAPRRKRAPRVTRDALQRAAVHHLSRYPASREQLRRVLVRRLERAERRATDEGPDREVVLADIAELLDRLDEAGQLDDRRLARALALDLLRRGSSELLARNKLRVKGLSAEHIAEALDHAREELASNGDDPALVAATAYARRRRLGPFRVDAAQRAERRDKDLAALARRGFSYGVARTVIEADDPDGLPQEIP